MSTRPNAEMFSNYRLGGEPLPDDLAILLAHAEELTERTGIELIREEGRAPWLDTSYLSETDRQDPGIMANVGAIADVCALIAFVGSTEDGEHFGYWRGRDRSPLSVSPVVRLDSEGQFRIIAASFAEAVLHQTFGDESFAEVRDWLRSLGIDVRAGSRGEIAGPSTEPSPDELHEESYRRRLGTA